MLHNAYQNLETSMIVCSSGFMTYRKDIHSDDMNIKKQRVEHPFTFILLPSLGLETCVQEILKRQMSRSYLKIILTNVAPTQVANKIKNKIDQ